MRSVAVGHLVSILLAVTACPHASHAAADDNPLLGTWEVADAVPAPWTAAHERPVLAFRGHKLLHVEITFKANDVIAKPAAFGCKKPYYDIGTMPPDALFQANLPEPKERFAKALGFQTADITSVDLKCSTGLFSYHLRDKNTALVGLDNVIYTLKRR